MTRTLDDFYYTLFVGGVFARHHSLYKLLRKSPRPDSACGVSASSVELFLFRLADNSARKACLSGFCIFFGVSILRLSCFAFLDRCFIFWSIVAGLGRDLFSPSATGACFSFADLEDTSVCFEYPSSLLWISTLLRSRVGWCFPDVSMAEVCVGTHVSR